MEDLFVCSLGFLVTQYFGFVYRHTIPRNFRLNISWKSHHNKALKCVPFFSCLLCASFTLAHDLSPSLALALPLSLFSLAFSVCVEYYILYFTIPYNDVCMHSCVCVWCLLIFSHSLFFFFFFILTSFKIYISTLTLACTYARTYVPHTQLIHQSSLKMVDVFFILFLVF